MSSLYSTALPTVISSQGTSQSQNRLDTGCFAALAEIDCQCISMDGKTSQAGTGNHTTGSGILVQRHQLKSYQANQGFIFDTFE